jgi:hypothetical protein
MSNYFVAVFPGHQWDGINVVAVSTTLDKSKTFEIVRKSDDLNRVRIKAPNLCYRD